MSAMVAPTSASPRLSKTPMKQGTLAAFIKTPLGSSKPLTAPGETTDASLSEVVSEDDETPRKRPSTGTKSKSTIDMGANVKGPMDMRHLPPVSDLNEMFSDLIDNPALAGIQDLVDRLDGRKLRIATMCSGTESPLLVSLELSRVRESRNSNEDLGTLNDLAAGARKVWEASRG